MNGYRVFLSFVVFIKLDLYRGVLCKDNDLETILNRIEMILHGDLSGNPIFVTNQLKHHE